jgi:osmotically-inducible protein OsmY
MLCRLSRRLEIKMRRTRTIRLMTLGLVAAGVLSGCATFEKSGFKGCPGDAQITAEVKALFDKHPALGTSIDVQTRDHVVYLYGLVDSPLESEVAESVALEAPGVTRVVSTIAYRNS